MKQDEGQIGMYKKTNKKQTVCFRHDGLECLLVFVSACTGVHRDGSDLKFCNPMIRKTNKLIKNIILVIFGLDSRF